MASNIDYSTWDIVKATQYGYLPRCKQLVEEGYDVRAPDKDNITLLHWAAINNRLDIVKYYVSLGAVVDALGGDLMATPLHWAIREGHLSMVVMLMQFGADPGVRDAEGCAAIHAAVQCGHTHIVAYLIAKGVDPDSYDANGKTPLMWAAWRTMSIDPTRTLLSLYASVNMKDLVQRNTPLHWACLSQNTNVVMMLIQAGADLNAKNDMDETPLDIAKAKKNIWISSRIKMIRNERGLDSTNSSIKRLVSSKSFRKRTIFFLSFLTMFAVGFILHLETSSWFLKAALFVLGYFVIYGVSMAAISPSDVSVVLPLAISLSTKFWVYVTSFYFFWPVIYSPLNKLVFLIFTPAMWYFFYKSMKADPGVVTSHEDTKKRTIISLAEKDGFKMDSMCTSCLILKPLRSKHCTISKKCIAKFDHYCPWLCNPIGSENHVYYISYLFFLLGLLLWNVNGAFVYWSRISPTASHSAVHYIWLVMQYSPWIVWIFANCVFHALWVFALLGCQLYQISWLGITTNERMNAGRYRHFGVSQNGNLEYSPFNRGFFNNLADFFQCSCFGLFKPQRIDWRTRMKFEPEFHPYRAPKAFEDV